jgi:maltodextrin utilization protein YvdJ
MKNGQQQELMEVERQREEVPKGQEEKDWEQKEIVIEKGSKNRVKVEWKEEKRKKEQKEKKKWLGSESVEELIDLLWVKQQESEKVESKEDR